MRTEEYKQERLLPIFKNSSSIYLANQIYFITLFVSPLVTSLTPFHPLAHFRLGVYCMVLCVTKQTNKLALLILTCLEIIIGTSLVREGFVDEYSSNRFIEKTTIL